MKHFIPLRAGKGICGILPPTEAKARMPVAWVRAPEAAGFPGRSRGKGKQCCGTAHWPGNLFNIVCTG
jgi:hypothetical protein